jgi:D-aminoacyl-tRNA deacylase
MKIVLQRVKHCSVTVDGNIVGRIGKGIMLLLGVDKNDGFAQADFLAEKCAHVRIFPDESGKMNLSAVDAGASALVVSQFTLFGDCDKGRRPSFSRAAGPDKGRELYDYFVNKLRMHVPKVESGIFGAMMDVELVNDGPVTLILEKENPGNPEKEIANTTGGFITNGITAHLKNQQSAKT